jgi:mRNA-degrading endonuclease toxin of MazEF toxin-antitoxin module
VDQPPLKQGMIVRARIVPPRGEAKPRPAVVCTPDALIPTESRILVVGISGSYYPDDPTIIPLPWRDDGRIMTRLRKPSAISLTLYQFVDPAELQRGPGYIPDSVLAELLAKLRERGVRV